jgi:hypothetical protein
MQETNGDLNFECLTMDHQYKSEDLPLRLLRQRRTRISGRVQHMLHKVNELQQLLEKAKEGLSQERHHFKLLDRLLALHDGRRVLVQCKPERKKPQRTETKSVTQADIGKLFGAMSELDRNKLLAELLKKI